MLTGERRTVSARRGMTVLGKIPAVPKPINLPSQRLENRGLDPNVELVPRGSVSWSTAGRSPPTSNSPWANSSQSSSPPVSSGPWGGAPPRPVTPGNSGLSSGSSGGAWGANALRPSSAGSGTRPSSAGSLRQPQEAQAAVNTWGPATTRPASASGVLGQAQPPAAVPRPRSAETRTRFGDQPSGQTGPQPAAWGGSGGARKLTEESHQPSRFTLTRVDFPTLGSEKNPDLRPQQNRSGSSPPERLTSVDDYVSPVDERPPSGSTGPHEEFPPTVPGPYGVQERVPEGWRREPRPPGSHSGMPESAWHRDGPPPMQPYGSGQLQVADTWRRDQQPGHGGAPGGGPSDDNWRNRGSGHHSGPYGPHGPGRFQPDPATYMYQQRFGPGHGPQPYGRGAPGPSGYGRHGDMYGNAGPFGRPVGAPPRQGPPMGPGMYNGPFDNYYGPPGPGYGNMDDREMAMLGMNGPPGMYGNFPPGPLGEPFGRFAHGIPGQGPRQIPNNSGINRERGDSAGYDNEGYREGAKHNENPNFKDGTGFNKESARPNSFQDSGENRRAGPVPNSNTSGEVQRPSSRGGHHGPHRDWGAAASSDEPMDFSEPVFEEDVSSASPIRLNDQVPPVLASNIDIVHIDASKFAEQSKVQDLTEDVGFSSEEERRVLASQVSKDSLSAQASKPSDTPRGETSWRQKEGEFAGPIQKSRGEDVNVGEPKDQIVQPAEKRWGKESKMPVHSSREHNSGRDSVFSPHGGRGLVGRKESRSAISGATTTAAPPAVRSAQTVSSTSNNRLDKLTPISVPQGPPSTTSETVLLEEAASPSVHEKPVQVNSQASNPTSPSGSDSQRSNDKLRILRRSGDGDSDSPQIEGVNIAEASHTEIPGFAAALSESHLKDDTRSRSKSATIHDGEKEWRPKVPLADIAGESPRSLQTAGAKPPTTLATSALALGAAGGATVPTEKSSLSTGNLTSPDSYDYEAQRARMKEIAAQRAIQLRKEEEERIKEQKAKALAKLEELNRRSLTVPASQLSEESAVEESTQESSSAVVHLEEAEVVSDVLKEELHVTENSFGAVATSTPRGVVRNGRNEHGKRERVGDRKGNGRSREDHRVKMSAGEHRDIAKGRLSTSSSQVKMESPLLPPSRQSPPPQPLVQSPSVGHTTNLPEPDEHAGQVSETSSSLASHVHHQISTKGHEGPHKGKQYALQQKQMARQSQSTVEADQPSPALEGPSDNAENTGEWITNSAQDSDSKEVLVHSGTTNVVNDTVSSRRRKVKNNGRNKQKPEGLTISSDSPSSIEPNNGWNLDLPSNDSVTDAGKLVTQGLAPTGVESTAKAVPSVVFQTQLVPQETKPETATVELFGGIENSGSDGAPMRSNSAANDGGSLRTNGDLQGKRSQRKPQTTRRASGRERGTSQDVRVGDKPHGGEGMIWAPVRSPSGSHPPALKGGFGIEVVATSETTGEKKEEIPVVQQTGRARRAELERYTPKPVVKQHAQQQEEAQQVQAVPSGVNQHGVETSNVLASSELQPSPKPSLPTSSEIRFGSEAWQGDSSTKQTRSHTSWRQRAPGNERASTPKDASHIHPTESAETGGKVSQPSHGHQTSQQNYHRGKSLPSTSSEQSRPATSQQSKAEVANVSRQQSSTPVSAKEKPLVEVTQQGRPSHSNVPLSNSSSIEKEPKTLQEGVTPYQPPRPGSSQRNRGLGSDLQSSHDHPRTHRANVLQNERQQYGPSGKFDRDHNSHERAMGHQLSRSQRHQGPSGLEKDTSQPQFGTHQPQRPALSVQPSLSGASATTEKDHQTSSTVGQAKPVSKSVQGQTIAPVLTEKEQNRVEHVGTHQPRSPARPRPTRHDKEHHRDVSNAVHHQHRGVSDGHWQHTAGPNPPERKQPSADHGPSEGFTRSVSHKSQANVSTMAEREHAGPRTSFHQHSRPDSQNKPQGAVASDAQKQPQYQPVSQSQKVQQQLGPQNPNLKLDNAKNSSQWNGERGGSPPPVRVREQGHSRRGRSGGRFGGVGPGRSGDSESKREHLSKQRLPIDAAGGAVSSQVGS